MRDRDRLHVQIGKQMRADGTAIGVHRRTACTNSGHIIVLALRGGVARCACSVVVAGVIC